MSGSLKLDSIVVLVDYSPESERALRLAGTLARAGDLPVELLAADGPGTDVRNATFELGYEGRRCGQVPTKATVVTGDDTAGILVAALRDRPRGLPVLGTRARGRVGELLLGSVPEELLVRGAPGLLLAGPHTETAELGTSVVVGVEAGGDASPALAHAVATLVDTFGLASEIVRVAGHRVVDGILDRAGELGGGIVVVDTQRWGGRSLEGSVARELVHRSRFPVYVHNQNC
jgi:nucleotide-binding universal stress UspA family protein